MANNATCTTIGIAWADLMALIPRSRQARALELALILHGQYASGETSAEGDGFRKGYSAGQEAGKKEADEGYKDGWDRGYQNGLNDALAKIGAPAVPAFDGDPLLGPPKLRAC